MGLGEKSLFEATAYIQEMVLDPKADTGIPGEKLEELLYQAKAGFPGAEEKVMSVVERLMERYGLSVSGMTRRDAAWEIYKYLWGLDVVEDLYRNSQIDEIRINAPEKVYYQERGCNSQADVRFKDNEHIKKIIARMLEHDRAHLDESNPGCVSKRLDGSRVVALCSPVTLGPCFVVRKHGTFEITGENYIRSGTMSEYILSLLSLLVKGRANILICGDAGVGKTTLLRFLFRFLHPRLRVVSIELNRELFLEKWYPDRDIVSLEAHPELGWDLRQCLMSALWLSPDVIIVGEARGLGEAGQMISALRSGHHGSMGTIHVYSVYEAVSVLAQMAYDEGRRLPVNMLEDQVASVFNVIIQMYGNSVTGVKKVERIVEVWKGKEGPEFSDLCVWEPSDESYEEGRWRYPNGISERLSSKLFKYGVSRSEISRLEEMREKCN